MKRTIGRRTVGLGMAGIVGAAGLVGLGALAIPAGAGQAPVLPPVGAEELVASVIAADPPALRGDVRIDNAIGLPGLPGLGEGGSAPLTDEQTDFRVWADGDDGARIALPSSDGEQVVVTDGETLWRYDSAARTATSLDLGDAPVGRGHADRADQPRDPAAIAGAVVGALREYSDVRVDGTAEVAGRPAYELVLSPAADERTLLREVRVAVDSETRTPLRLSVLTDGTSEPAMQVGFTDITIGQQDPALFSFTPPSGVTVEQVDPGARPDVPGRPDGAALRTVGEGWDTVVLTRLPAADSDSDSSEPRINPELLGTIGERTSGTWGDGVVVRTAVGTAIIADDGRIAAGAVPEQVLAEALAE